MNIQILEYFSNKTSKILNIFQTKRPFSSCPLPVNPHKFQEYHKVRIFTSTDHLISRGLLYLAQKVIQKIIYQSSSISEALYAVEFGFSRGLELDSCCLSFLIQKIVSFGDAQVAETLFKDCILSRGIEFEVDFDLLDSLVLCYCKLGKLDYARLHFDRIFEMRLVPSKEACNALLRGYCKIKNLDMAMSVFVKMIKLNCEPDNFTYNTLIQGFVKLGLYDKAWLVFRHMAESGLVPNAITYQLMINQYCIDGKVDCALALMSSMSQCNVAPAVHSYTTLMNALYKENRIEEADRLYMEMVDGGFVPDHVLYFTLIKNHQPGCEINLALQLVQAIAANGCGIDLSASINPMLSESAEDIMLEIQRLLIEICRRNMVLANNAFSIYLMALCTAKKLDKALICLDKMVRFGLQPLLSAYNALIKCLLQEGLVGEITSVVEVMEYDGLLPSPTTFLIIINEHCKRGRVQSALNILHHMEQRGLKPTVGIYDAIIRCLSNENSINEAEKLFDRMLESGIDLDESIFVTMINAYCNDGRAIQACELFDKIVHFGLQRSSRAYTSLISGLVKISKIERSCWYLNRMFDDGFEPDTVIYTSLISQFVRNGQIRFAFSLVDLMEKNQIKRDMITYITLVSGLSRNIRSFDDPWYVEKNKSKEMETMFYQLHHRYMLPNTRKMELSFSSKDEMKLFAMQFIKKIQKIVPVPNLYLFNGVISVICCAGRMQEAYNYFHQMLRKGLCPNKAFEHLCFEDMRRNGCP
ncbi:hypothetical protein Leryth_023839 [Lithospermum erythrorhizon]|nr:hypothetical protein Leryth_023839 [Lithospermum erythrorhizon]